MRRLILILTDGLRPDAITPNRMPSLDGLANAATLALHASTIRPSSTVAALAALATGELRSLERGVVSALAGAAGVEGLTCAGQRARDVALAAGDAVARGGVTFVYLNDCDRAGHAHGWMSPQYLDAAVEVDRAIGVLSHHVSDSLLLVLADHGGGGVNRTTHHEPHPENDHIPLILAGPGVTRRHRLTRPISILDVPPTVCHWFGVPVPESYEGRALTEAFVVEPRVAGVNA